jgi:hypothetical protein
MRPAACLFVALATCYASVSFAQEREPLTKISSREMTPEQLTRRLFGELAETLLPVERRARRTRPVRRLFSLNFYTQPIAAQEGLCRTQRLTVHFDSIDGSNSPKTPVRPSGMTSETFYLVHEPRVFSGGEVSEDQMRLSERICPRKDPRSLNLIQANDDNDVAQALTRLAAIAEVRSIDCSDVTGGSNPLMNEVQCQTFVRALKTEDVEEIRPCRERANCHELWTRPSGSWSPRRGENYVLDLEWFESGMQARLSEPILIDFFKIID